MALIPGQVFRIYDSPGSYHFCIVISEERFNRGDYVHIVPITSKGFESRSKLSNCVAFRAGQYCFTSNCVAQGDALSLVEISSFYGEKSLCEISGEDLRKVIRAVGAVIGAECEPLPFDGPVQIGE